MDPLTVGAILAAIVSGVVAIYLAASRKHLNEAQATEALTNAAVALLEPQQKQIETQRDRIVRLETWSAKQDEAISELRAQHTECLDREIGAKAEIAALNVRLDERTKA